MPRLAIALVFTLSLPLPALADTVIANSTFLGDLYGTWAIDYPTGPAGLYLQQVTIDIGPTNPSTPPPAVSAPSALEDVTPSRASAPPAL